MENDPPPVEVVTKDGVTYRIRQLTEVSQVLPRLERDQVFAAYAICQLEPERFPYTRWYVAEGETGEALVMSGTDSLRSEFYGFGADLFCMGDPEALGVILSLHPGPRFVYLWARPEHRPILKRHYYLQRGAPAPAYGVTDEGLLSFDCNARILTGTDVGQVNRLIWSMRSPSIYPGAVNRQRNLVRRVC